MTAEQAMTILERSRANLEYLEQKVVGLELRTISTECAQSPLVSEVYLAEIKRVRGIIATCEEKLV